MHIRTARAILQRLALCAGLCAGAWVAAEGLDHGTAHADDVPVRIEQEQPSERPGGLLDSLLDGDAPGRGNDEDPPPNDDNGRGDQDGDESPPVEEEPADDNGRGEDDPPAEQPRDDDEPDEDDTPIRDVVDEILDEVLPDPPGLVDGDDGSPQHPVDTPPAPDPAPVVETPNGDAPAADEQATAPVRGGQPPPAEWAGPAPWASHLTTGGVQTDLRTGGSVCDSRDDHSGTGRSRRPGTSPRDRADVPRRLPGPGLVPLGAPCGPPGPTLDNLRIPPATASPADPGTLATAASGYLLGLDDSRGVVDGRADALPPSRLTLWPPRPG